MNRRIYYQAVDMAEGRQPRQWSIAVHAAILGVAAVIGGLAVWWLWRG